MSDSTMKWEIRRRLEEIERRLFWTGRLGRGDLMSRFGISPQQASADLQAYLRMAPEAMTFNGSARRYEAAPDYTPQMITPSVEDYVAWRGEVDCPTENVPLPLRNASVESLKTITRAIHQRRSVEIGYRSIAHPKAEGRRITPHILVFDNQRYHVRAWCHRREAFRDFVLGRITRVGDLGEPGPGREVDVEWHTLVIVRFGPHPGLSTGQRKVIEADYGMETGEAQIRVRQALLIYLLRQLHLDEDVADTPPEQQQIVLLNPEVRSLVL